MGRQHPHVSHRRGRRLRKVTWPTREELVKATRMIIVFSIALGFTIGLLDWLLQVILVGGVARLTR